MVFKKKNYVYVYVLSKKKNYIPTIVVDSGNYRSSNSKGCASGILDCAGTCDGSAVVDCAGTCNGSATKDCAGVCDGTATSDDCASKSVWCFSLCVLHYTGGIGHNHLFWLAPMLHVLIQDICTVVAFVASFYSVCLMSI